MNPEKAVCYFVLIPLLFINLLFQGCATSGKSAGLGAAIGGGTGALLGGIIDPGKNGEYRTRNVIVGGALGGTAGLFAGSLIHHENEKEKKEAFLQGRASAPPREAGAMPTLKPAVVRTEWVERHRVGSNRVVEGHFEYVIDQPAQWEP